MIWERTFVAGQCGSCGATIAANAPVLLVSSGNVPRCEGCAKRTYDTEPPADLPTRALPTQPEAQPFAAARNAVRDYKLAQAGDDDAPSLTDRVRQLAAGKRMP